MGSPACLTSRTAVVRTRTPGGVGGGNRKVSPYPDFGGRANRDGNDATWANVGNPSGKFGGLAKSSLISANDLASTVTMLVPPPRSRLPAHEPVALALDVLDVLDVLHEENLEPRLTSDWRLGFPPVGGVVKKTLPHRTLGKLHDNQS